MKNESTFLLGRHEVSIPIYEAAEEFIEDLVKRRIFTANPVIAKVLQGRSPATSTRNIQRHYANATGLTRQRINQIHQARKAFVMLQQGKPIAQVASEAGYADQAHLTRSLKLLAGQTPGQIIQDYLSAKT